MCTFYLIIILNCQFIVVVVAFVAVVCSEREQKIGRIYHRQIAILI